VFRSHFGTETVFDLGRQVASEDFSGIPDAFGVPYTYSGLPVQTLRNINALSALPYLAK